MSVSTTPTLARSNERIRSKTKEPDHAATPTVDSISTIDDCIMHHIVGLYNAHVRKVKTEEPDYETPRPLFSWLPVDTIKRTLAATTQLASIPMSTTVEATDTVYSDTRDIDSGAAQLFVGTETLLPKNPPDKAQ
jgi:hypothetical protein